MGQAVLPADWYFNKLLGSVHNRDCAWRKLCAIPTAIVSLRHQFVLPVRKRWKVDHPPPAALQQIEAPVHTGNIRTVEEISEHPDLPARYGHASRNFAHRT